MREPNAEQKAKAQARREKMRALAKEISSMSPEARAGLAARCPVVTIEGRALSEFNQCFVAHQNPNVTIVGGFRQWKKSGRSVRKGEHGLAIWIPIGPKVKTADGTEETSEVEFFALGTVFDVSQTEEKTAANEGPSMAAVMINKFAESFAGIEAATQA